VARGQALTWGKLRTGPVGVGGTDFKPPLPNEREVEDEMESIMSANLSPVDRSMDFMLYMMRSQLFWDGNKRTAMLVANKIMIENGCGVITVAPENLLDFNTELSRFYSTGDGEGMKELIYEKCIDGTDP
jgi:hypothetical protein